MAGGFGIDFLENSSLSQAMSNLGSFPRPHETHQRFAFEKHGVFFAETALNTWRLLCSTSEPALSVSIESLGDGFRPVIPRWCQVQRDHTGSSSSLIIHFWIRWIIHHPCYIYFTTIDTTETKKSSIFRPCPTDPKRNQKICEPSPIHISAPCPTAPRSANPHLNTSNDTASKLSIVRMVWLVNSQLCPLNSQTEQSPTCEVPSSKSCRTSEPRSWMLRCSV